MRKSYSFSKLQSVRSKLRGGGAVNLFTERNSDAYLKEYFLDRAFHDDVFIS